MNSDPSATRVELIFVSYLANKEHLCLAGVVAANPAEETALRELDESYRAVSTHLQRLGDAEETTESLDLGSARYSVLELLGSGGMADVFEVQDRELGRIIAAKVPSLKNLDESVSKTRIERLRNEARVVAHLEHPAIVPVHDLGLALDGRPYFTMRRIDGDLLVDVIAQFHAGGSRWTRTQIVQLLTRATECVAYAHSRGVVHRDLKPQNLIIGEFGAIYVLDWGLAKVVGSNLQPAVSSVDVLEESPVLTQEGHILGTPQYLAPELIHGEAVESSLHQCDIYSMGATLYQALTGIAPYSDSETKTVVDVMDAAGKQAPTPIAKLAPQVPAELVAIAECAMERKPTLRYSNSGEFVSDLRAYLEGRVVRAHRTGALPELAKWIRRNPGLASLIAAAALGLVLFLGVQSYWITQMERADYENAVVAAKQLLEDGQGPAARQVLESCPSQLRSWEWDWLWRQSDTTDRVIKTLDKPFQVVWSPGDKQLAYAPWNNGPVRIIDVESEELLFESVEDVDAGHTQMAFSPDGDLLACGKGNSLLVFEWKMGLLVAKLQSKSESVMSAVTFDDSGSMLWAFGSKERVSGWSTSSWELVMESDAVQGAKHAAFDASLGVVLFSGDQEAWLFDSKGEKLVTLGPEAGGPFGKALLLSEDSAVTYSETSFAKWDLKTGRRLHVPGEMPAIYRRGSCVFSERTNSLLCANQSTIESIPLGWGEPSFQLFGSPTLLGRMAASNDRRWLASCSDGIRMWDLQRQRITSVPASVGGGSCFSSCSSSLWVGDGESLRHFEPTTGLELHRVPFDFIFRDLAATRSGGIWVHGRNGIVGLYVPSTGAYSEVGNIGDRGRLTVGSDGDLWCAAINGRIKRWSSEGHLLEEHEAPCHFDGIAVGKDPRLVFVCGARGSLARLDAKGHFNWFKKGKEPTWGTGIALVCSDRLLIVSNDTGLRAYDTSTLEVVWESGDVFEKLAVSPDGTRIFVTTHSALKVILAETGKHLLSIDNGGRVSLSTSHDGRFVVTRGAKGLAIYDSKPWLFEREAK